MLERVAIPNYTLESHLGRGAQGDVYQARHNETKQIVALKLLRNVLPEHRKALRREVEVLKQVNHPGMVRILDSGLDNNPPWYAMELLRGPTLRDVLSDIPTQRRGVEFGATHVVDHSPDGWTTLLSGNKPPGELLVRSVDQVDGSCSGDVGDSAQRRHKSTAEF